MCDNHAGHPLHAFLTKTETQPFLDRIAGLIYQAGKQKQLPLNIFHFTSTWADLTPSLKSQVIAEIKSELILLCLENTRLIETVCAELDPAETVPFVQRRVASILKLAFINHWIDQARKHDNDSFHRVYKRVYTALNLASDFTTQSLAQKGTVFSMDTQFQRIELSLEDRKEILFPPDLSPTIETIATYEGILNLARYFYQSVSSLWGQSVGITIRDFLAWLMDTIDISPIAFVNRDDNPAIDNQLPYNPPNYELSITTIESLAHCFAARLTAVERSVFYHVSLGGLTLKKTAAMLGLKSASGVKYHLDCAHDQLRHLLIDQNGLTSDDLKETAFQIFLQQLKIIFEKDALKTV